MKIKSLIQFQVRAPFRAEVLFWFFWSFPHNYKNLWRAVNLKVPLIEKWLNKAMETTTSHLSYRRTRWWIGKYIDFRFIQLKDRKINHWKFETDDSPSNPLFLWNPQLISCNCTFKVSFLLNSYVYICTRCVNKKIFFLQFLSVFLSVPGNLWNGSTDFDGIFSDG